MPSLKVGLEHLSQAVWWQWTRSASVSCGRPALLLVLESHVARRRIPGWQFVRPCQPLAPRLWFLKRNCPLTAESPVPLWLRSGLSGLSENSSQGFPQRVLLGYPAWSSQSSDWVPLGRCSHSLSASFVLLRALHFLLMPGGP